MEGVEGGSGGREWRREWREEESKLIQASMCILSKISGGDSGGGELQRSGGRGILRDSPIRHYPMLTTTCTN